MNSNTYRQLQCSAAGLDRYSKMAGDYLCSLACVGRQIPRKNANGENSEEYVFESQRSKMTLPHQLRKLRVTTKMM